jgi:hypothetical protein
MIAVMAKKETATSSQRSMPVGQIGAPEPLNDRGPAQAERLGLTQD